MKIILDDEWYIVDNGAGYTLTKVSLDKTRVLPDGSSAVRKVKELYPGNLEQTIKTYIRYSMQDKIKEITFKDYIAELNKKTDELIQAITGKKYNR